MKKNRNGMIIAITAFGIVIIIMYLMFRDSWQEIRRQIWKADKAFLLLMLLVGNLYIFMDGLVFRFMIRRNHESCSLWQAVRLAYMVVFFNVTTFGMGTKPAQVYLLYQNGTSPGKSMGILALEYVSHKSAIMLYAAAALLLHLPVIRNILGDDSTWLYAGFGISLLIVCFLLMLCVAEKPAIWFDERIPRIKKPAWKEKAEGAVRQMQELYKTGRNISKDRTGWILLFVLNAAKMTCSYILPVLACYAVMGEKSPVTFRIGITFSAVMQLLIGVIPSSGGTGSTEIVYFLLFGRLLGNAVSGATLILYRMAIYYFPFLLSIPIVLFCEKSRYSIAKDSN